MRAYYSGSVEAFLNTPDEAVMNALENCQAGEGFDRPADQRMAWRSGVAVLRVSITAMGLDEAMQKKWSVLLEYSLPGRKKRLDAVLLNPRGIIAIEFKAGKATSDSADQWQLLEYCWNLRDFHRASVDRPIAPILVPTELPSKAGLPEMRFTDQRQRILTMQIVGPNEFADAIRHAFESMPLPQVEMPGLAQWESSMISPCQNIIEAARAQFEKNTVREIAHSHADNTDQVVERIGDIVRFSREKKRRSICFVTGVPGAGKTLVGLRVAYQSEATAMAESAPCFASGNLKLLNVLAKALKVNLARSKADIRQTVHDVTAPLWDVHKFARLYLSDETGAAPAFRVVVFDEAQRVWTAAKVEKSFRRGARRSGQASEIPFELTKVSEPEMLLRVMERFPDWCVVVALVGGGQEIHDGEAGLKVWGEVLEARVKEWEVWVSPEVVTGGASVAGQSLFQGEAALSNNIHTDDLLHLSVSRRSYRAARLTEWVNALLLGDAVAARATVDSLSEFRVELTRSLKTARHRLREFSQEERRIGLVASSGAKRLRAEGVEIHKGLRDALNWPNWFLESQEHIDSSSKLEIAATEFECQGLELDHTSVCWGTDFVYLGSAAGWRFRPSRGRKLKRIEEHEEGPFVVNKYRVLLTRAREGMVIFVPRGDERDPTRSPSELDGTANFLRACGIPEI